MEYQRVDRIFTIVGAHLGINNNQEWAERLGYESTSQVSRIRTGRSQIPEQKIMTICRMAGLTRSDFDLPPHKLADRLDLLDALPKEITRFDPAFLPSDVDAIKEISGRYALIYLGRDLENNETNALWIEPFDLDSNMIGGYSNTKRVIMRNNYIINSSVEGRISCIKGVFFMSVEYPGHPYPPSTFLLRLVDKRSGGILFGSVLDVNAEDHPAIYMTHCIMFQCGNADDLPRAIRKELPVFERWKEFLTNKVGQEGRITARRYAESVIQEGWALIEETKGLRR